MGLLNDVFGGPEKQLLSEQEQGLASRQALRDFGLSLLLSGAPPGAGKSAPPFLAALAAGAKAGQASYAGFAERTRTANTQSDINDILANGLNPASLESAYARALQGGDIETARTLGSMLQTMMEVHAREASSLPKPVRGTDPVTGEIIFTDPLSGALIGRLETPEGVMHPGMRAVRDSVYSRFMQASAGVRDVANSYRRVLSATNTLIKYEREAALAKRDGREPSVRPTAAAMAAISSFARLLDPGSVVREGEFRIVSDQGSMVDRIRRWWESISSGMIPEGLAQALQDEAWRQTTAQHDTFEQLQRQAWAEAEAAGLEREWVPILDPFQDALDELRAGNFPVEQWLGGQGTGQQSLTPERMRELDEAAGWRNP